MNSIKPPALSPCQYFWNVHVPSLLEVGRDTTLSTLSCTALFRIAGAGGGEWTVSVRDGVIESLKAGADADATATIELSESTFVDIALGRADHRELFFAGRISISGDVPLVLWLANLIPVLRDRFPFRLPEGREVSR